MRMSTGWLRYSLLTSLLLCNAGWAEDPLPAAGTSLLQAYSAALQYDPKFQAAIAGRDAAGEETPIARAALLPDVSFSASEYSIDSEERSENSLTGKDVETQYDSGRTQFTARQPLLDIGRWHNYQAGKLKTQLGEQEFRNQQQDLAQRVTFAYLDTIGAESQLLLAQAELTALEKQLQQAQRYYESGEGTITDVDEVTARRDLAKVHVLQAQDKQRLSRKLLQRQTGLDVATLRYLNPFHDLSNLQTDDVQKPPVETGLADNPKVQSENTKASIANEQRKQARAKHAPVVQAVGIVRDSSQDDGEQSVDSQQNYVGVELQVPIFSGMGISASSRQAADRYNQARFNADAILRDELLKAEEASARIISGIAETESLRMAVRSARKNLLSMQKGMEAGQRTNTDVLDAEHHVFQTLGELVTAAVNMLKYYTVYHAALGSLNEAAIGTVESYLTEVEPLSLARVQAELTLEPAAPPTGTSP